MKMNFNATLLSGGDSAVSFETFPEATIPTPSLSFTDTVSHTNCGSSASTSSSTSSSIPATTQPSNFTMTAGPTFRNSVTSPFTAQNYPEIEPEDALSDWESEDEMGPEFEENDEQQQEEIVDSVELIEFNELELPINQQGLFDMVARSSETQELRQKVESLGQDKLRLQEIIRKMVGVLRRANQVQDDDDDEELLQHQISGVMRANMELQREVILAKIEEVLKDLSNIKRDNGLVVNENETLENWRKKISKMFGESVKYIEYAEERWRTIMEEKEKAQKGDELGNGLTTKNDKIIMTQAEKSGEEDKSMTLLNKKLDVDMLLTLLKKNLGCIEANFSATSIEKTELTLKVEEKEKEIKKMKAELQRMEDEKDCWVAKVVVVEAQNTNLEEKRNELEEKVYNLKTELQAAKEEGERKGAEVEGLKAAENEKMKMDMEDAIIMEGILGEDYIQARKKLEEMKLENPGGEDGGELQVREGEEEDMNIALNEGPNVGNQNKRDLNEVGETFENGKRVKIQEDGKKHSMANEMKMACMGIGTMEIEENVSIIEPEGRAEGGEGRDGLY